MITGIMTLACLSLAAGDTTMGLPSDVVPVPSHKFKIPITVLPERKPHIRALELYWSRGGKSWELAATATPDQPDFAFTAPTDGLYWFSVVVIDSKGLREPPDVNAAPVGQKILVDTLKPDVRIVSTRRQGEAVVVSWEIKEENPDLSTLRLEWQGQGNWVLVRTQPALQGEATFKAEDGPLKVRLTLSDVAGNMQQTEATVEAAPREVVKTVATPKETSPGLRDLAPPPPVGWSPLPAPPPAGTTVASGPTEGKSSPVIPSPPSGLQQVSTTATPPARNIPETLQPVGTPPPSGVSSDIIAASGGTSTPARTGESQPKSPPPQAWNAAPTRIQVVNNRRVMLEYEVDGYGPSGVGGADLYVTRDDGRTWQKMVSDSPPQQTTLPGLESKPAGAIKRTLAVDLAEDGVYGFTMIVRSGAGLSQEPPRSGDAPQMRLELDTVPPQCMLRKPMPSPNARDALVISWTASDKNLAPQPITLQWAERATGPWQTIGEGQMSNLGSYLWRIGQNVPARVYLRLTVRDQAGNVAVAETPEPILVDLSLPRVTTLKLAGQP